MGVYGIDFYGVGRFGRDPSVVRPDFSVQPFTTTPLDYSTLHVMWVKPASTDCVNLRLVRNTYNLPQSAGQPPGTTTNTNAGADGTVLFTDITDRPQNFTDTGLGSGFYYYTMWGWSNTYQVWVRCSDVIGLVPINYGYGWRLYDLMPMAYRDADLILVDPYNPWTLNQESNNYISYTVLTTDSWTSLAAQYGTTSGSLAYINGTDDSVALTPGQTVLVPGINTAVSTPPLQRYLRLIGFQLDFIRTELESLMSINDANHVSGALLPLMAQQFAIPHEPEIGMQQERQLVANAVHLYKKKGSPRGLTEFCSIMTSYPATSLVHHGYNCLLTMDDSAFTDAIGTWQPWPPPSTIWPPLAGNSGLTLTWMSNLMTVNNMTDPVLEIYGGNGLPIQTPPAPPYQDTGMRIQATGAGDLTVTTQGIPITDFMSMYYAQGNITFRIQIWSAVSRQVYLSVWGDVGTNSPVQIIGPTQFAETAGHWVQMTVTAPINPYPTPQGPPQPGQITPVPAGPASYYRIFPRVRIAGAAANEAHYITLCSLWPTTPAKIGVDTPTFDYSRDVKVVLQPQYSNLLSNTLTTFSRLNPNPPPAQLLSGFDGLCAASDPVAKADSTGVMTVRQQTLEDAPGAVAVNGTAALQFTVTGPNGTVWFGKVVNWSAAPPSPNGWFDSVSHNWFPGAIPGSAAARPWFGPDPPITPTETNPPSSWFFEPEQETVPSPPPTYPSEGGATGSYFGVGASMVGGVWFPPPPQPAANCNITPFNVQSGQPFNFSLYAEYLTIQDPTNAVMMMGFRWYYPDGTWVETTTNYSLTPTYERYSIAPANGPFSLSDPPVEAVTGLLPSTVYPFVRFPLAQQASFLMNSAMLAPSETVPPYMDATTYSSATGEYIQDPSGASYYYAQRTPRIARLTSELYRWLPMGSTYSIVYESGAVMPPLDPTLW